MARQAAEGAHDGHGDRERHVIIMAHHGEGEGRPRRRQPAHGDHHPHDHLHPAIAARGHRPWRRDIAGGDAGAAKSTKATATSAPASSSAAAAEATPAQRAEQLQRARERLAGDDELSAEQKARITAALDREIARLRGQ